jgi:hypothetical protein
MRYASRVTGEFCAVLTDKSKIQILLINLIVILWNLLQNKSQK